MAAIYTKPDGTQVYDNNGVTLNAKTGQAYVAATPSPIVVNNGGGAQPGANLSMAGQPGYDVYGNKVATNNTPASVYAGLGDSPELIAARNAQTQAAKTAANGTIDENAIRSSTLASFQAEIDAQNQLFAHKLAEAKVQGANRIGQGTAIQARRGLLGSDFGAAQTDTINNGNNEVYAGIDAEKADAVSRILSQARQASDKTIADKTAAKAAGLDSYVKYLQEGATRSTTNAQTAAALLLTNGQSPDTLEANDLQAITDSYGITPEVLKGAFVTAKKAKDAADAEVKQKADKAAADLALTTAQTGKIGTDAALAAKKFDEDVRQFGLDYALKKQDSDAKKAESDSKLGVAGKGTTELGTQALNSATALLKRFDEGSGTAAVGKSSIFPAIPGTANADFRSQFDSLKAQLSLEGVKYLKGQGAVSDAERALLASATSNLSLSQSEPEFRKQLASIVDVLSGKADVSALLPKDSANPPKGADGAEYGFPGYVSDGTQWVPK